MLTLDALRRMADRMPTETVGDSGGPPFRKPDPSLRTREIRLPKVREEARRAAGLFAFVVIVALAAVVPAGVLVTHAAEFGSGADPARWFVTARWFAGWTLLFIVPFAGIGLVREVLRLRRVRRQIGEVGMLTADGCLRSVDGERAVRL